MSDRQRPEESAQSAQSPEALQDTSPLLPEQGERLPHVVQGTFVCGNAPEFVKAANYA
jgi:hypothetical protein